MTQRKTAKTLQLKARGVLKPPEAEKLKKLICLCKIGTRLQRCWWISCSRHLWSPGGNLCIHVGSNSSLQLQTTQAACLPSQASLDWLCPCWPRRLGSDAQKTWFKNKGEEIQSVLNFLPYWGMRSKEQSKQCWLWRCRPESKPWSTTY